jgi:hypothetical protein
MNNQKINKGELTARTSNRLHRYTKNNLIMLFIPVAVILLSACQITDPLINSQHKEIDGEVLLAPFSYSQYYLWLKSLTKQQVLAEEKKYKTLVANQLKEGNTVSQSKLILIYSLPTTPLHQPYKAKRLLNEQLIISHKVSEENLAFSMLLRDQLNTQLHLLEKQSATNKECNKQLDERYELIEQLQQQVNQVNQQLILLKKIDLNINKRSEN